MRSTISCVVYCLGSKDQLLFVAGNRNAKQAPRPRDAQRAVAPAAPVALPREPARRSERPAEASRGSASGHGAGARRAVMGSTKEGVTKDTNE